MIRIMSTPLRSAQQPLLSGFHEALLAEARTLRRPAGAALFLYGKRPAWMYYLNRGEAVMQRVTPTGACIVLQRVSHGFIAEASLTSTRYHCDALCRTDCDVLAFPLAALREAIDTDEGTRWAWINLLSAQSRQQRARIERQALKTIRERLHHLLLTEGTGNACYDMPGTRMELAADLGVTPEALYRCLSTLQREGTLIVEGQRLSWVED